MITRSIVRKHIVVKGIVQGVGFRPFVYKLAVHNNLKGWVKNTSKGRIAVSGAIPIYIGGLATTLSEISEIRKMSIVINEKDIPIKDEVISMCELLGFDPLYVANEEKLVVVVFRNDANKVLEVMRKNPLGKDSKIIGKVINDNKNNVYLKTEIGGTRLLNMVEGELLPRIC